MTEAGSGKLQREVERYHALCTRLVEGLERVIRGKRRVLEYLVTVLLAGGHVLIEDVPGLGKTTLAKTMARLIARTKRTPIKFRRIQFTPDLLPYDITGVDIFDPESRRFLFRPGPIFANIVLADEINRATPKTQSAMLEAMQEHTVTSGGTVHKLPEPFLVLATQNPIEQEGTYPLPEAQLDRFFFKLIVPYSSREELGAILDRTTAGHDPKAEPVLDAREILDAQALVRRVVVAPHVQDYAIRLVLATHPQGEFATEMANKYVRFGASPRGVQAVVLAGEGPAMLAGGNTPGSAAKAGVQAVVLAGKVRAMLAERYHVGYDDMADACLPAMRHRVLLNFEGQAEGISNDDVLADVLDNVPRTMDEAVEIA